MTGPDRIWIDRHGGNWSPVDGGTQDVEYIRRDPAVLAALPEVQALIAAAYEVAAKVVDTCNAEGPYQSIGAAGRIRALTPADATARILATIQPDPEVRQEALAKAYGPILDLLPDAVLAAGKAMRKYPQPNYVISKWAEETGEVTKDLIHMAEGRQTADKLRGEIVQSLAMLHRLMIEGDQVHGLLPLGPQIRALTPPADLAAQIGGE